MSIGLFDDAVSRYANSIALVDGSESITFGELAKDIAQRRIELRHLISRAEKLCSPVVLACRNSIASVTTILTLGTSSVPLVLVDASAENRSFIAIARRSSAIAIIDANGVVHELTTPQA